MNKLKLIGFASVLATGIAQAAGPCENFGINLKNQLADDLVITRTHVDGAQIDFHSFQKLNAKTENQFNVTNSVTGVPIRGKIYLSTVSLPRKEMSIKFVLSSDDKGQICVPLDISPSHNDYSLEASKGNNHLDYSIINK